VASEPCALVRFVDTISDRHHTTTWLKDWYFKTRQSQVASETVEKEKSLCRAYRTLMDGEDRAYEFSDATGRQLDLGQRLTCLAARSASLAELLDRAKGEVKENDFQTLKSVYEYFEPLHHCLVWAPRLAGLEAQLAAIKQMSVESKLAERLACVQKFMKTPPLPGLAFTVAYVPLPAIESSTHGESLGCVQVVELLPERQGAGAGRQMDVVFHEACHSLWQSRKNLAEVQKMFESFKGGRLAFEELNEGMATALGQGWFMKESCGRTARSWYMDRIINKYAHALYPLLADYLKNDRPMDLDFARKACAIFRRKFPGAARRVAFTSSIQVFADSIDDMSRLKSSLNRALPRLHSYGISSPVCAGESISSFKENRAFCKAILLPARKLDELSALGLSVPEIEFVKSSGKKPVMLKHGDNRVLFCVADKSERQQEMLFSVLHRRKWRRAKEVD
jgi:hypothetical protein